MSSYRTMIDAHRTKGRSAVETRLWGLLSGVVMYLFLSSNAVGDVQVARLIVGGPPVPIAGSAFTITVFGQSIGAPFVLSADAPVVDGSVINLALHITTTTSSTFPSNYSATFDLPPLSAGNYTVNYFVYFPDAAPIFDLASGLTVLPMGATTNAIEFYNSALDHYFMTASAVEIAALDAGQFQGWARTGEHLHVYVPEAESEAPFLAPVCRYYGLPSAGLDTHFFSAFASECSVILQLWPNQWILETNNAFDVFLPGTQYSAFINPDPATCPPGTLQVYRLYDNRPDVNHRYTTSPDIRDQMVAKGWIPEGVGTNSVGFCSLPE